MRINERTSAGFHVLRLSYDVIQNDVQASLQKAIIVPRHPATSDNPLIFQYFGPISNECQYGMR